MTDPAFTSDAIHAALKQDWSGAIQLNLKILKEDKKNTDAYNRLAFAYMKNGQIKKAKETFEKTLSIDPYNQIAAKNIKRIALVKKGAVLTCQNTNISPLLFLEEPGKTKVVECINAAPMNMLSLLSCGQQVYLNAKSHSVEVRDDQGTYIGALPDDLAFRLLKLITAGNEYSVFVKGVSKNCISVFIREVKRGKKLQHQPSFIGTTNYIPYQREVLQGERKVKEDEEETEHVEEEN